RIAAAWRRRSMVLCRRLRSRIRGSAHERGISAARGARLRRPLRPRDGSSARNSLAPGVRAAARSPGAARPLARAVGVRAGSDASRRRVDPAPPVGLAVKAPLALALWLAAVTTAWAGDNYALVISGASGGDAYGQKYDGWRTAFVTTLREKFGYPDDHVVVLAEREGTGVARATR